MTDEKAPEEKQTKPNYDVKLSTGAEIKIDLNLISVDEYDRLYVFDNSVKEGEKDAIIAKTVCMTVAELRERFGDYRVVVDAFFKKCKEPLTDPNSPSAST